MEYVFRNDPANWLAEDPVDFTVYFQQGESRVVSNRKFKEGDFIILVRGICSRYDEVNDPIGNPESHTQTENLLEILFQNKGEVWISRSTGNSQVIHMKVSNNVQEANCHSNVFQYNVKPLDGNTIRLAIY
jgi:hypothetical protein